MSNGYHVQDYRQTQSKDGMEYKSIRAEGVMFGSGSKLKEQALEVIYDVVMKDGTITKMPMSEYHKKMNGSLVDWIADSNA